MKNKFILASVLSVSLMLTGCGSGNAGETAPAADNASETVSEAADLSAAGISETEETHSETEEETTEEETAEEETAEEEITEEEAAENVKSGNDSDNGKFGETDKYYGGVFHGRGYTVELDSDIWVDFGAMAEYVKKAANNSDIDFGIDFTDEMYSDMYDGMFISPDSSGATINMAMIDVGIDLDMNAELIGSVMEQQYSAIEGCSFLGCEDSSAGGYDCVRAEVEMTSGNKTIRMLQYCFWENEMQLAITFSAQKDEYDELLPEFEKAVNTVSFE